MQMFFQNRRMMAWREVDKADYALAYDLFGGSVLSHPLTLNAIEAVVDLPIQYYAFYQEDILQAVIPVWKKWVAGSKKGLKNMARKGVVDLGNAELILPIAADANIVLPVSVDNISTIHKKNISNLKPCMDEVCLAKAPENFSKKFRYNRKREWRLLKEQGATIGTIEGMTNAEVATMYARLFELRWGFKPTGYERLNELLDSLRPLLFGSVVRMDGKAIAFQLIYKAESVSHISLEYINGGVDPAYSSLSPGSVLTFLNTQQAWALSESSGKPLRYSFGRADNEYKDRWCTRSMVYSV